MKIREVAVTLNCIGARHILVNTNVSYTVIRERDDYLILACSCYIIYGAKVGV